jgi:hypothetical protein
MASKDKSFVVPQAVRDAAQRGLDARKEHGRGGLDTRQAKKEGVGSGVQRASNLIQGRVTYATVKRMLAFFNRHKAFKEHHDDPSSAAKISWDLWGGNAGFAWAKRIVKQEEKVEKGSFLALSLGLSDDDPIFDEPIGGEPIGGEPVLSFTSLLKASKTVTSEGETVIKATDDSKTFTEVVEEAEDAKEILDGEGELDELTEEDAKRLHAEDPMIMSTEPFEKSLEPEDDDDDDSCDDTLDAEPEEETPDYQPHLRLDPKALNPHIKKAMKLRGDMSKSSSQAKKIGLALRREQYGSIDLTVVEQLLDGLGSDEVDDQIEAALVGGHLILDAMEKAEPHVPDKYLTGLTGKEREKRKKQIQARIKGKESYKPMEGDDEVKTKPSKYTKTKLAAAIRDEIKSSGKDEFLRAAAKVTGIKRSILEKVYDRGLKAWATSGHRVGASAQQWARARLYSFASGGSTQKTADKDLWEEHTK